MKAEEALAIRRMTGISQLNKYCFCSHKTKISFAFYIEIYSLFSLKDITVHVMTKSDYFQFLGKDIMKYQRMLLCILHIHFFSLPNDIA